MKADETKKATVIALLNHKGGVGKTTSTVNIAAGLHASGKRILLIDIDPQANLTLHLLGDAEDKYPKNIYGALKSEYPLQAYSVKDGLDMVVSTLDLCAAELELLSKPGRDFFLRELISPYLSDYDYIFIDCPPSLGVLTINALAASKYLIIPAECSAFALKGMTKLFTVINEVKYYLNKDLVSFKILITKYDSRKTIQRQIASLIQSTYKDAFTTTIRSNVTLEEASMQQRSVFDVDPKSAGAIDYMNVCNEIINEL